MLPLPLPLCSGMWLLSLVLGLMFLVSKLHVLHSITTSYDYLTAMTHMPHAPVLSAPLSSQLVQYHKPMVDQALLPIGSAVAVGQPHRNGDPLIMVCFSCL